MHPLLAEILILVAVYAAASAAVHAVVRSTVAAIVLLVATWLGIAAALSWIAHPEFFQDALVFLVAISFPLVVPLEAILAFVFFCRHDGAHLKGAARDDRHRVPPLPPIGADAASGTARRVEDDRQRRAMAAWSRPWPHVAAALLTLLTVLVLVWAAAEEAATGDDFSWRFDLSIAVVCGWAVAAAAYALLGLLALVHRRSGR